MPATQEQRLISVSSPLAKDRVLFQRMRGRERLGRPFAYEIDLLSENSALDFADFLGQHFTVEVAMADGGRRCFDGLVSSLRQVGTSGRYYCYQATLHPWIWFLGRTKDCRIFQDLVVPDIIKQVFRDHSIAEFEESLNRSYRTRGYCVQYRESDLDFVSRLMEEEGIYYYFKHSHGKHTLVLSDAYSAHESVPDYQQVPYFPPANPDRRKRDHVYDWQLSRDLQTGNVALDDFDFERPKADLAVVAGIPREHGLAEMEVFDYPGGYREIGDGEQYARTAIEAEHSKYEVARGKGNARGLMAGGLFELVDYPRADQNREYLILSAEYELVSDLYESANLSTGEIVYRVEFEAMDSRQPYRSPRVTPKAVVRGPQTAIVVGEQGEEITTDKYGRVKVQFHWDRYGTADQTSSCWVRVAQAWAGAQWGAMHIPRIGQEVIVDFLEGDPDRPIITGRVYNGDNMPPYPLPANATISTLKSNSSKGGGGFNEIRLEDKKGSEQIFVHAERNQDVRIKNDGFEWVGNERHLIVKADQLEKVEGDKHLTVQGDRNEKVLGTVSMDLGMDLQQKVGIKHALDAGQEIHLKAGMNVVIEAGASITLKAGGGFIVIGPSGVTISGMPVLINSGGAAGSGSGCSPDAARPPKEATNAEPGASNQSASASVVPGNASATEG